MSFYYYLIKLNMVYFVIINSTIKIIIKKKMDSETNINLIEKKGLKSKIRMIFYGINLSLGGSYYGITCGLFNNLAEKFFNENFNIKNVTELKKIESDLAFYFFIGCFLCALLGSFLYENIGRLKSYYFIIFLEILSSIFLNINILNLIFFARLIQGFCACFWMFLSHLMIKECVDIKFRAFIANSFLIFMTLGQNLIFFLGSPQFFSYWRVIMFLPIFIEFPRLLIMFFYFKKRSPVFLYKKIKNENDRKIIIQKNYEIFYENHTANEMTIKFLEEQKKIEKGKTEKIKFIDLFKIKYRKQFLLSILINFLTQITGINVLNVFSTEIFKELKLSNPETLTYIMSFFGIISAIFITIFGKKIGKKKPIIISILLVAISWGIVIIGYNIKEGALCVFGIYCFMFFFNIYIGIQYSYLVSFLPSIGLSFSSVFKWSITIFLLKYILVIIDAVGIEAVFVFFFVMSFLGFFGLYFFVVDTDGKTDSEILKEFYNEDNHSDEKKSIL